MFLGTNMSTVWKLRPARTSRVPSPSVEVIISARNTTMQEMIRAMRQPVSTAGSAAISTTVNSARRGVQPAARADQTSFGSTAAVPCQVASRIGNTASAATSAILEEWSKPRIRTIAG